MFSFRHLFLLALLFYFQCLLKLCLLIKIFNETFSKVIVTIIQDIISNIVKIENTLLITSVIVIIVYVIISITKDSKKETVEKL